MSDGGQAAARITNGNLVPRRFDIDAITRLDIHRGKPVGNGACNRLRDTLRGRIPVKTGNILHAGYRIRHTQRIAVGAVAGKVIRMSDGGQAAGLRRRMNRRVDFPHVPVIVAGICGMVSLRILA